MIRPVPCLHRAATIGAISVAALMLWAPVASAQSGIDDPAASDDGVAFGIRPNEAQLDEEETFSYFIHHLNPGDQIDEMVRERKSLMPEGLLKDLTDRQVRDLFAYLHSSQPLNN